MLAIPTVRVFRSVSGADEEVVEEAGAPLGCDKLRNRGTKQMIIRCVSKSTVADYGTSIILNVPVKVHKRGECTNLRALPLLRLRLEREEKLLLALT